MLLAVTGLAGAGKTTSVRYLEKVGVGRAYYAGDLLRQAVVDRGLTLTPENEREVRAQLREEFGMDVFAAKAVPHLRQDLQTGHMLLDAIYNAEEQTRYAAEFPGQLLTVAISADQLLRAARLGQRPERPLSPSELARRDAYEVESLRIGDVISSADETVINNGTLSEFEEALSALAERVLR